MTIDEVVRRHTLNTLRKNNNCKKITAQQLGVSLKTLYNWLNKWGLNEHTTTSST